jgi:CDP-diacylglycerol---glycerol-3-phosphate 3-phosphatidyltransferase
MIWNLPMLLTWLRIVSIPLVCILVVLGRAHPAGIEDVMAGLLFAIAAITDSLDGYLARRLGQTTKLVLLVSRDPRRLVVLMAVVIIGREIAISALREWMAELGQRTKVAVSALGKYKTIMQMVGLSLMLYRRSELGIPVYTLGLWLTVLAALLTLVSMFIYLRAAFPYMRERG